MVTLLAPGLSLQIVWSDSGELLCIATEESFFVLRYLAEKASAALESRQGLTEDGVEDAFEVGRPTEEPLCSPTAADLALRFL